MGVLPLGEILSAKRGCEMETSCFGRCYSIEARECRLCDVREECKSVMESAKAMPCYGEYNEESYACIRACHVGGEPSESKCAAVTLGLKALSAEERAARLEELKSGLQPTEVRTMEERTEETAEQPAAVEPAAAAEPVAEAVEAAAEPVAEAVEAAAEPVAEAVETAAEPAPTSAKNKKDVIRNALRDAPPEGVAADTIVQMIVEAGFVPSNAAQEVKDKTRHYVIMSISHMRKAGKQVELKEGKYVLVGDQSPAS